MECPSCKTETSEGNMTTYQGEEMCEGCAESIADKEYYTDPHGKNWQE